MGKARYYNQCDLVITTTSTNVTVEAGNWYSFAAVVPDASPSGHLPKRNEMMRRSQQVMMNEVAPHDGHRRTILDPYATHVGIGMAWEGGEFRLAQEFVRRYIDWSRALPRTVRRASSTC